MLQISAELLAMTGDAAVLVKNERLIFANAAAMELLGLDCVGKTVRSLLGEEIAGMQGGSFIAECSIRGLRYIVRESSADGIKAIFIAKAESNNNLINEAFIFSMRNCLMNMDVSLSLLREKLETQPELCESIAVISHDSFRINRILSNLGIIHDQLLGQAHFVPDSIDISRFVGDIVNSVSLFTDGPEINFHAPRSLMVWAMPTLVESLVLNLISNCLLHAKGCKHISISLEKFKNRCIISVDDDGCGIPPEQLHQVFDRYKYGFDASDISCGPGLGLSTTNAIARLHGGTLLMESRPGHGTAVRVSIGGAKPDTPLGQNICQYEPGIKSLLTGLAHCLPSKFYTEKYMD